MKSLFLGLTMLFTITVIAEQGPEENYAIKEEEKRCFKEVKALNCGRSKSHESFIACVAQRMHELTPSCQEYHHNEVVRITGRNLVAPVNRI